jgi:carboxymethylenebutenolidase
VVDQLTAEPATPTQEAPPPVTQIEIDQRVFDLYDEYCHGRIDRREFLLQAAAVTAGGLVMAQALLPRYAQAQTISFTDPRINGRYVGYPSPGGTSGLEVSLSPLAGRGSWQSNAFGMR